MVFVRASNLTQLCNNAHAFFDRDGGVSKAPYDGLNVGALVGDAWHAVEDNRARVASMIGRADEPLVFAQQVHGTEAVEVTGALTTSPQADVLWTTHPHVTLGLYTADCVPILLAATGGVAAAHAGWKGTAAGVARTAVTRLTQAAQVSPQALSVALGPAIGPCCYEVSATVAQQLREAAPHIAFAQSEDGRAHVDLWAINEAVLRAAGVSRIEVVRICTSCSPHYFSHRRDQGRTGRQASVIGLV